MQTIQIFRSFKYKNYTLYFIGQGLSLIGFWVQNIAINWLIYRLTNSELILGVSAFISQIPNLFISPLGGIIADKFNRKTVFLILQVLSMFQAIALTILTFLGQINLWHIIGLGFFMGFISGIETPVRQSFVSDIVQNKEDLGNAIALNSIMFNTSRFIGPMLAGVIILISGEKICFLINAISYIAVIVSLLLIKIDYKKKEVKSNNTLEFFKQGFKYAFSIKKVKNILFLVSFTSLIGSSYIVLLPVFAKDILGGNSNTLGLLMGASGLGAIIGNLFLASKKEESVFLEIIPITTSILGIGLLIFSQSKLVYLSIFLMFFIGLGLVMQMVACNTVIQTSIEENKRGRVMSLYSMAFMGLMPIGNLFAGFVANIIGTQNLVFITGILNLLAAFIFKISNK